MKPRSYLIALVGIGGALHFGAALWRLIVLYDFPFSMDGNEPYMLSYVLQAAQGDWYGDLNRYPFLMTHYPPLGLYLLSLITRSLDTFSILPIGRVLSFAAMSGTVLLFSASLNADGDRPATGRFWLICAAAVTPLFFYVYAPLFVLGPFAAVFTWLGIYAIIVSPKDSKAFAGWLPAALLFIVAYGIKRTEIPAPLAVAAWGTLRGDRRAWPFIGVMALGVALSHGVGWIAGLHEPLGYTPFVFLEPIYENSLGLAILYVAYHLKFYPWLAIFLAWSLFKFRPGLPQTLWGWYALISTVAAIPIFISIGTNVHLFIGWIYALLAFSIRLLLELPPERKRVWLLLGILQMAWCFRCPAYEPGFAVTPDREDKESRWELFARLSDVKRPVFCLVDHELCLLNGQQPPINLVPMPGFARHGWDPQPLVEMIEREEFGAAVFETPIEEAQPWMSSYMPLEMSKALVDHYVYDRSYGKKRLYLPKGGP